MKIIKVSALILVLTIVLSMFAACGGNVSETPDTSAEETTEAPTTEPVTEAPELLPVDPLLSEIVDHMREAEKYLIFVIGDSLTEGQGSSDPERLDYTAKFTEKLAEQMPDKSVYRVDGKKNQALTGIIYPNTGKHVPVQRVSGGGEITVARCGIGGNTVKRIIDRSYDFIGKKIRNQTGDLFIIMSGINDSASNNAQKYASPLAYKKNLNTLLDMIYAEHPNADIILMTPTYTGQNGRTLDSYAKQMKDIGTEREIPVIDQHQLWMDHWVEGAEHYGQGDWLSEGDSCHPTDIGHEAIADYMIQCLFGIVK